MLGTTVDTRDRAIKVTGKVPTVADTTWWEIGKAASKQINKYIHIRILGSVDETLEGGVTQWPGSTFFLEGPRKANLMDY